MNKPKPPIIDPSLYKIDDLITGQSDLRFCKNDKSQEDLSLDQIKKEFDNFSRIDINNPVHHEELLKMHPPWLLKQASEMKYKRYLSMNRYDNKNGTFVAGCYENTPRYCRLVSYKRRRTSVGKWITRKGTHPNASVFIDIRPDGSPVFVVEGVHDAATAELLGISFIMIPYAGFRLTDSTLLQKEVAEREVVFLVEDEAAHKCMKKVAEHLRKSARKIYLKQLGSNDAKADLSNYVQNFNTIEEVINGLQT